MTISADALKRFAAVVIAFCIYFFLIYALASAALVAPEFAKPGELVKVTSDEPADWVVQPDEYNATAYIDTNRKTLVLANAKPGTVYIFAATTDPETNEPKAFCWRLEISDSAPDPKPEDVKPADVKFPQTVADALASVESENKDKERQGLVAVLNSTIGFIDAKSITTPAGARETIRRNWTVRAASISADTETNWAPVLIQIFAALTADNLPAVKTALEQAVAALGGTE